ncbi:MAG: hypothetical protein V4666_10500 [Bacteroidota bacterium]
MKKILNLLPILLLLLSTSCQNNDFDDKIKITDIFSKSDPLFKLLENVATDDDDPLHSIVCIDFVYPFQLLVYNQNHQIINQTTITGDLMFSDFLTNLPSNNLISISYPLQTTLADGTIFTVNNNSELKMAIDACSKEDIISYCSGLFGNSQGAQGPCVWKVPFTDNENNEFAGAVFTANTDGTINLNHLNTNYTGTWVFLFLNDELNLNINLSGTSTVATSWNLNYKAIVSGENLINIKSNNTERTLIKNCKNSEDFEIGDIGLNGGIIGYKKSDYSNGWQYIEVAPTDLTNEEWGCMASNIPNSQFNQIGSGQQNTYSILNYHNSLANYYTNPAICSNLNAGTLTSKSAKNVNINNTKDWFIPSKNELQEIYNNLSPLNLGNFENANYWSSTEANTTQAKTINLQTGVASDVNKNSLQTKTRVIRYF